MTGGDHGATRRPSRLVAPVVTVGAAAGTLCMLVVGLCFAFGIRPLVFESGSMSPTIDAGDVAFARTIDVDDVEVGDVVSVVDSRGVRVTHRVVGVDDGELTLRGDANPAADADRYRPERVQRVVLSVPKVGHVVEAVRSPLGLLVSAATAAALVAYAFRPGRTSFPTRAVGAVVLVAAMASAVPLASTMARFSDSGTVASGPIATHTVMSQAHPACQNVNGLLVLGNVARLTWTKNDARYEYRWELRDMGGSTVASGTVGGDVAVGATVTLNISTGLIGTNADYDVVVRARLRTAPSWTAAETTTTPVHRDAILVIGAAMRCGYG